jgi:electron transport complex protein RnfB
MSEDLYEKLWQSINKHGIGMAPAKSGVELRLLAKMFTEEEARMYMHLTEDLETPEVIASRAKQDPEEVASLLKRMTDRGLTFPKRKGDTVYYAAPPFAHGLIENQTGKMDKEFAQIYEEYKFAEKIIKGPEVKRRLEFKMPLRVVPVMEPINTSRPIAAYEDAKAIIMKKDRIAVAKCLCAEQQQILESDCKQPIEVCLMFGFYAEYYVETGMGRWITQEEALSILDKSEEFGLVHQITNYLDTDAMCNCCWDCCGMLQVVKTVPNPAELIVSNYFAQSDPELCNGCGTCVDRCPIDAITLSDEEISEINLDRCVGCGLCISTCKTEAMTLVSKPDDKRDDPPVENLFMKSSVAFESKLE